MMIKTVERRVAELHEQAGSELQPLGVAPIPKCPQLHVQPEPSEFDWILLRLEDDPLFRRGELDIPVGQRDRLVALDDAGVRFDDLLIAHEVPKGSVAGKTLEAPDVVETALAFAETGESAEVRALRWFFTALRAGAVAVVSAPLAAVAALNPDPVLIGLITAKGDTKPGIPAAYFLIARW